MTKLVFSYSHADEPLRDELEKHLSALKRQGLIDTWHDRRILAGQEWKNQIDENFEDADVVLLLVSPDFISSDYCHDIEMKRAIERHHEGTAVVIPVILRPCHWQDLLFGQLQAATKDGRPISHFPTLDDGFYQVVGSIKAALAGKAASSASSSVATGSVAAAGAATGTRDARARSSQLRIKQEFTDRDRDHALTNGFVEIVGYMEESLKEMKDRNPGVETDCRRPSTDAAEFSIYRNGKRIAHGGVWIERGRSGEIHYSHEGITRRSYNESMSVVDDGYILGFHAMGMARYGERRDEILTAHGAAEYFWEMLTGSLR